MEDSRSKSSAIWSTVCSSRFGYPGNDNQSVCTIILKTNCHHRWTHASLMIDGNLHCKSPFRFETAPDITIKRVLPTFTPSGDHSLRDGRWLSAPGNYTLRKSYLCIGPQYLQCMSGMTHIVSNWDPAAYITSAIDHSFSQQTSRTATIYLLHLYCSHGWAHKMGTLLLICSLFQSVLDW